jgi:hypothetical protein
VGDVQKVGFMLLNYKCNLERKLSKIILPPLILLCVFAVGSLGGDTFLRNVGL